MKEKIKYFKVLGHAGLPFNGGKGKWNLPQNGNPGDWMPKIEEIIPCRSGYHLCEFTDLMTWLGPEIYEAEGKFIRDNNKTVFQQARIIRKIECWNERTARLFAADCAEHVLHLFEGEYPKDLRPREAIQAARDFANGKIDAAAGDARDAAGDAWAAAGDARDARGSEKKWQIDLLKRILGV